MLDVLDEDARHRRLEGGPENSTAGVMPSSTGADFEKFLHEQDERVSSTLTELGLT